MDLFADQIVDDCSDELPIPKRNTFDGVVFRSRRRRRKDRLWRQVNIPVKPSDPCRSTLDHYDACLDI